MCGRQTKKGVVESILRIHSDVFRAICCCRWPAVGAPLERTAPAGSAGTVDITVTSAGGTSSTSAADQFTYVAAPTVTSVSPISGSTAGGTSNTITGTNLTRATGITVGGSACSAFSVTNSTTATCTTPAGSAGTASVLVTTAGGTNAANTLFTYVASVSSDEPIPTLSEWAMIFLASLMGMFAFVRLRKVTLG
jgi:hypothetical protein